MQPEELIRLYIIVFTINLSYNNNPNFIIILMSKADCDEYICSSDKDEH